MTKEQAVLAYLGRAWRLQNPMRMMGMLYLSDWKSCLQRGRQITDVSWTFFDGLPCFTAAPVDEDAEAAAPYVLTADDRAAIDHVIRETSKLDVLRFIQLVQSTYPALASQYGATVDLPRFAEIYLELQRKAA